MNNSNFTYHEGDYRQAPGGAQQTVISSNIVQNRPSPSYNFAQAGFSGQNYIQPSNISYQQYQPNQQVIRSEIVPTYAAVQQPVIMQ